MTNFDKSKFSQRLKDLRKKNHMTQKDLANKLNKNVQTIKAWENPDSPVLQDNYESLVKMALLFQTTCDYLLTGEKIDADAYIDAQIEKGDRSPLYKSLAHYINILDPISDPTFDPNKDYD